MSPSQQRPLLMNTAAPAGLSWSQVYGFSRPTAPLFIYCPCAQTYPWCPDVNMQQGRERFDHDTILLSFFFFRPQEPDKSNLLTPFVQTPLEELLFWTAALVRHFGGFGGLISAFSAFSYTSSLFSYSLAGQVSAWVSLRLLYHRCSSKMMHYAIK